jgi:uncharacterized membrane protein
MRPAPAHDNIETVARLEKEFLDDRTRFERIGDAIGAFIGTMGFVLIHVVVFTLWVLVNVKAIPGVPAFDPYPFMFLSLAVSLEGVLLTTFVLMKQNRMSKRAEQRNQLNLQVDLLSEKEVTKILQMLRSVCDHMGIDNVVADREVKELAENTAVDEIAREIREKMPE